ncbi:MAG TPA: flippase [Geobacteraceae bacterium]|nr:flippase [Geobacteraceae bacterium]
MNHAWIRILPKRIRNRIEQRRNLQKIISNTGWLFADKIIRMGCGLVIGVWVARYLGPTQFGLLNFAGSFVTLFSAIALLGLEGIIVRELVKNPPATAEILGTTCFLRLTAGSVAYAMALGTIFVIRPAETISHALVAIGGMGLLLQAFDTIDLWYKTRVSSKFVVLAKNGAFLVSVLAKVFLILFNASLIAFAWANLAEIVLGAIGLALVYRMTGQHIAHWRIDTILIKKLLKEGLPLVLSGIAFMVYLRVDQVMLGQMAGDREVGIYSAAVRVAEIWYFIPTAIISSVFPDIIHAREISKELFLAKLQKLYNLLAFMGYAVAVPTTFLAGWVINLLFGPSFAAAAPTLAVLVWAGVFANLGVARNAYLLATNRSRILLFAVLAGAVSNVLLNLLLIPAFGSMGAAIASCLSYWFAAHGACYLYRPLFKAANMLTRAIFYPRFW